MELGLLPINNGLREELVLAAPNRISDYLFGSKLGQACALWKARQQVCPAGWLSPHMIL